MFQPTRLGRDLEGGVAHVHEQASGSGRRRSGRRGTRSGSRWGRCRRVAPGLPSTVVARLPFRHLVWYRSVPGRGPSDANGKRIASPKTAPTAPSILNRKGRRAIGSMPRTSDSVDGPAVRLGADVVVAPTGGDLVTREQVAAPEDQADTEAEEGRGPEDALHRGRGVRHVGRGQPDGGQQGQGPAGRDAQFGPPGAPWGRSRSASASRPGPGGRRRATDRRGRCRNGAGRGGARAGRPRRSARICRWGQRRDVGSVRSALGGRHPRVPIMRTANHRKPNPKMTPTNPSATGPKWEMPRPPGLAG